jgi:hypothetical protein
MPRRALRQQIDCAAAKFDSSRAAGAARNPKRASRRRRETAPRPGATLASQLQIALARRCTRPTGRAGNFFKEQR